MPKFFIPLRTSCILFVSYLGKLLAMLWYLNFDSMCIVYSFSTNKTFSLDESHRSIELSSQLIDLLVNDGFYFIVELKRNCYISLVSQIVLLCFVLPSFSLN